MPQTMPRAEIEYVREDRKVVQICLKRQGEKMGHSFTRSFAPQRLSTHSLRNAPLHSARSLTRGNVAPYERVTSVSDRFSR